MNKWTSVAVAVALLSLASMRLQAGRVAAADPPLLVIVGVAFPAADVSMAVLKDAFRGRTATLSGKRLIPINHAPASPERVHFDRSVLGLEPAAVGRFWVDVRIRDEGKPPTTAASADLAVRITASLANTISYATEAELMPKVKVLTVDGKSAKDPGYPLAIK